MSRDEWVTDAASVQICAQLSSPSWPRHGHEGTYCPNSGSHKGLWFWRFGSLATGRPPGSATSGHGWRYHNHGDEAHFRRHRDSVQSGPLRRTTATALSRAGRRRHARSSSMTACCFRAVRLERSRSVRCTGRASRFLQGINRRHHLASGLARTERSLPPGKPGLMPAKTNGCSCFVPVFRVFLCQDDRCCHAYRYFEGRAGSLKPHSQTGGAALAARQSH